MTFLGITVDDADSLDAAADLRESYGDYCARMADELAAEAAIDADDLDGDDPDDPSPVTPAAIPGTPCQECDATGVKRYWTGGRLTDWVDTVCTACDGTGTTPVPCPCCHGARLSPHSDFLDKPCWYCDGTGHDTTGEATPPAVVPFDRAAHCRRIAGYGGLATLATHGYHHFRVIGQIGARVTIARHGYDVWRGIATAKGWQAPRQVSFLDDLRAGRELAALDRIAA